MGVILDERYQTEAYDQVKSDFQKGNRSCVVFPTGCGKTYIALKMIEDNPDKEILYVSPSPVINVQIRNIIKQIYGKDAQKILSHIKFTTYSGLSRMSQEEFDALNPDMIVFDELHRAGATIWNKRVNELLEKNKNAKVLGLTATPVRTDGRNMAEEICGGISYELPITEAVARGILRVPEYICSQYIFEEDIQRVEVLIEQLDDEKKKNEYKKMLEKARRYIENAEGIDEVFGKHIKDKNGKMIIFCKDIEDIERKAELVGKWFSKVNDKITIYKVSSNNEQKENEEEISAFRQNNDDTFKVILAVNILNEGFRDKSLKTAGLGRKTSSEIVFRQQIGRVLLKDMEDVPQIFDLANNIKYFESFRNEIKTIIENGLKGENRDQGEKRGYSERVLEQFKIIEEQIDFINEFKRIEEYLQSVPKKISYLESARAIKKWIEDKSTDKTPSRYSKDKDEKYLGNALANIRQLVIKPYMNLEPEKQKRYIEEHPELPEIIEIIDWVNDNCIPTNLRHIRAIKKWMQDNKTTKPPSSEAKDKKERDLGTALHSLRERWIKKYNQLETEEAKKSFEEEHPEILEIIETVNWIDTNNVPTYLANARDIKKWMEERKTTKPPSAGAENKKEKTLGSALSVIRRDVINEFMKLKTEEAKEKYKKAHPELQEIMEIVQEIDRNNIPECLVNARAIKEWMDKRNTNKVPRINPADEEETRLARALVRIRSRNIKEYMKLVTEEEKEKHRREHPEIDEILLIISEIDMNGRDRRNRELANLIRQDLEKRANVQKMKELEGIYEERITKFTENTKG